MTVLVSCSICSSNGLFNTSLNAAVLSAVGCLLVSKSISVFLIFSSMNFKRFNTSLVVSRSAVILTTPMDLEASTFEPYTSDNRLRISLPM